MKSSIVNKNNIVWVDRVKIFALFFVVIGHLYMSFMRVGFVEKTAIYYCLPIHIIYLFHVQLFFVCSGFLHQFLKKDTSLKGHFINVKNKAIALGVPYFVFSGISLAMKNVFSTSVNTKARSVLYTLFIKPMSPYWYLYVLFFLFLLIPCFKNKRNVYIVFAISVIAKLIYAFAPIMMPYIIVQIFSNSIWFTLGMVLAIVSFKYNYIEMFMCVVFGGAGLLMSMFFLRDNDGTEIIKLSISILLVPALIYIFMWISKGNSGKVTAKLRKYILPIFLMHTIFAAGARILLLKLEINLLTIHLFVGIIASFALPMLVYKLIENRWYLLVFVEPLKAWKMRKNRIKAEHK